MPSETGTALLILVAFVLPGFVALLVSERTHTIRGEDTPFERLLQALYYSALTYALVLVFAAAKGFDRDDIEFLAKEEPSLRKLVILGVVIVFVLPVALSQLGRFWRRSSSLRPWVLKLLGVDLGHSTPAGWDHFFQSGRVALLRVTLRDERVVGGYYGVDSFAGYSEQARDLFLEERWELDTDSWFLRPAQASLGVWISRNAITSMEFYDPPHEHPESGVSSES